MRSIGSAWTPTLRWRDRFSLDRFSCEDFGRGIVENVASPILHQVTSRQRGGGSYKIEDFNIDLERRIRTELAFGVGWHDGYHYHGITLAF